MPNLFTSLLIGLLGLDTTIAFQVLLSQPIFSCLILGWFLGDVTLALEVGMLMQLLWLNIPPVGATVLPEGNVGSMVACVLVIRFGEPGCENLVFTVAVLIALLTSYVGAMVTMLDRKINGHILEMTTAAARAVDFRQLMLLDLLSIFVYFVLMSLLAFSALTLSDLALPLLIKLAPASLELKLVIARPIIWGIGIGLTLPMVYRAIREKR